MLRSLILVSFLGLAIGLPSDLSIHKEEYPSITRYYHRTIGIAAAARIKAAEEAIDFNGSRIVGGSSASLGQYPYFGGLLITLTNGQQSMCGSSLLTNTKAVSAAHCWWDGQSQARQFVVVLGSTTLYSGGTRITTTQVKPHEGWNPRTVANDVAIITITRVNYSKNIRNIALASGNNNYEKASAWAVGFGALKDGTYQKNPLLHHVELQVISNAVCQKTFGKAIIPSSLCVDGSARRAICDGDSGGPLAIGNTLIGITSFGHEAGCQKGFPSVFARITSFNSWIRARL
ncbi:hypothetical protein O0L34_g11635 [Tuta absoluta]|nr:hypothetical protein O0L34_g11635 [Tuta absoluta]